MAALQTSYEFTLPRGYLDPDGDVHRVGRMRLATARDELEPLRDPSITGPDDPRLTILVLARVVENLGDYFRATPEIIEGLFAVDLAFLQDFYGVINFGTQKEYDALMAAQGRQDLVGRVEPERKSWLDEEWSPEPTQETAGEPELEQAQDMDAAEEVPYSDHPDGGFAPPEARPPIRRATVEELPRMAR
jgi:hypothetical protein